MNWLIQSQVYILYFFKLMNIINDLINLFMYHYCSIITTVHVKQFTNKMHKFNKNFLIIIKQQQQW